MRDAAFGPLLRRVLDLLHRSIAVHPAGVTTLSAFEGCDELRIDAWDWDARDAIVTLVGVPSDIDPARVVDASGHLVWRTASSLGTAETFERSASGEESGTSALTGGATLVATEHRTWFIATGEHVSKTLEQPEMRRKMAKKKLDSSALATLTLSGAALVAHEPRLRTGLLAPIGRHLVDATASLQSSAKPVVSLAFRYSDHEATAAAATALRDVVHAFAASPKPLARSRVTETPLVATLDIPLPDEIADAFRLVP